MPKFIVDTDKLIETCNRYSKKEIRDHIAICLGRAHRGSDMIPHWLTPYQEKKSRSTSHAGPYTELFNSFWTKYPPRNGVKSGKRPAFKAWCKAWGKSICAFNTEKELYLACSSALEWQCRQENWVKEKGTFIPMASTYLNAEGWTDEKPADLGNARTYKNMDGRIVEE